MTNTAALLEEPTVTDIQAVSREFSDLDYDIKRTIANIDAITKRAAKKGLSGGYTYRIETREDGTTQHQVLVVEGTPVKANGWTLVANVTWEGEAPITAVVPGYEGPMIDRSTLDGHCDICHAERVRSHVIVCEHPEQGRKVVGGQCVKDLLGHEAKAFLWPDLDDLAERDYYGGSARACYSVSHLVTISIAATKTFGWLSRSAASVYDTPTADVVEQHLAGEWVKALTDSRIPYDLREQYRSALALLEAPETSETAAQVIEWAKALPQDSDFNANLAALASQEYVSRRGIATLAYAFTGWVRATEREAQRKAEAAQINNTPLGQPKDKIEFNGTVTGIRYIEGDYGTTTLVKFATDAHQVVSWFASNTWIDENHIGVQVAVKGTVKGTSEFRGDTETQVTRCTVTPTGSHEAKEITNGYASCVKCYGQASHTHTWTQAETQVHLNYCPKHAPKA